MTCLPKHIARFRDRIVAPGEIRRQARRRRAPTLSVGVGSDYRVEVWCALTGLVLRSYEGTNLVLNEGITWWLYNLFNDISGSTDRGRLYTMDLGSGSTAADPTDTDLATLVSSHQGLEITPGGSSLQVSFFLRADQYNGSTLREYLLRTSTTTGSQASEQAFTRVVLPEDIDKTVDITVKIIHRFTVHAEPHAAFPDTYTSGVTRIGRSWMLSRLHDPDTEHCTRFTGASAANQPFDPETDLWLPGGDITTDTLSGAPVSGQQATPNGQITSGVAAHNINECGLAKSTTDHLLFFARTNVNGTSNAIDYDWKIVIANRPAHFLGFSTALATGGEVTVTLPAEVRTQDTVWAFVSQADSAATFTPPVGWSSVRSDTRAGVAKTQVYEHVALDGDPREVTFESDNTVNLRVTLIAWRGADIAMPTLTSAGANGGGTAAAAPTISPSEATDHITAVTRFAVGTASPPDYYASLVSGQTGGALHEIAARMVTAGATGAQTTTIPSSSWIAQSIAIRRRQNPFQAPPPAAPTGLLATAGTDGEIVLTWNASAETDLKEYRVYGADAASVATTPANLIGTVLAGTETLTDDADGAGLTHGATRYYVVTAVNLLDSESAASNEDSDTVVDTTATAAPSSLGAKPQKAGVIPLLWTNPGGQQTATRIYRKASAGVTTGDTLAATIAYPQANYADTPPSAGTWYYAATSVDGNGNESALSNEVSETYS